MLDLRRLARLRPLLFGIVLVAVALRIYRLDAWPVFVDEDVFTAAVIELQGVSFDDLVLVTQKTARPPLPSLVQAGVGHAMGDPLLAGRALSVAAGTMTTVLSYALGARLVGPAVGVLTALLYAVSPLAVLHERMALQDGMLTAGSLAAVLVGWRALESGGWPSALAAAGLGALAVQLKLPGVTLAATFLVVRWIYRRPPRPRAAIRAVVVYSAPLASLVLAAVPFGAAVLAQVSDRLSPFDAMTANGQALFETLVTYFPAGLFLVPLAGAVVLARSQPRAAGVLLACIVCWTSPWAVLSNFAPSRYYLPALPFVLALAAVALAAAWRTRRTRVLGAIATVLLVGMAGWSSARSAVDFRDADLTTLDDWQYRSGWPSGFAYDDAARFVARSLEPGSSLAYLVENQHRVGAGVFDPKAAGVHVLGGFPSPRSFVRADGATLLVMIDDPRNEQPGQQLAEFEALYPDAQVVMRTLRPHAGTGVAIVRLLAETRGIPTAARPGG